MIRPTGMFGLVDYGPHLAWAQGRVAEHQLTGDQLVRGTEEPEGVGVRQHFVDELDGQTGGFQEVAERGDGGHDESYRAWSMGTDRAVACAPLSQHAKWMFPV